ncbi:hypothetical protein TNCV_1786191 [Trichonephila clavipes]|nr:hypothetical protein TNCV_1786191 [Trichonephila clavipes]
MTIEGEKVSTFSTLAEAWERVTLFGGVRETHSPNSVSCKQQEQGRCLPSPWSFPSPTQGHRGITALNENQPPSRNFGNAVALALDPERVRCLTSRPMEVHRFPFVANGL